jgi:capsular polysaccharide biosynthesis protein
LSLTSETSMKTPSERMRELADAVRRRWRVAAAVLGFTLVGAIALTAAQQKYYEAAAQILIQPTDKVESTINPGAIASQADASRDVTTDTQMITVEPVAAGVERELALHLTLPRLIERITVSGAETSNLVSITARDSSPQAAAALATAFARQYQGYRREVALQQINASLQAARENPQARLAGSSVAARVTQLEAAAASETGGVQIIRAALPPRSPASPALRSRLMLAFLIGLVLALAAVLAVEAFDRRLIAPGGFEAALDAPVLAVLAHGHGRGADDNGDQRAVRRRANAELAARLAFTDAARGARAIMISPASGLHSAGEFARGLAEALATLGLRVALLEGDIAAGTDRRWVGPRDGGGLTAILNGKSTFGGELTEMRLAPAPARNGGPETSARTAYTLLPSGPRAADPQALLARPAMREVLAEAKAGHDLVLVQTAAMDQVSSVLPLVRLCDGAILLAVERSINVDDARAIAALVQSAGLELLGIVLDDARRPGHAAPDAARRLPAIVDAPRPDPGLVAEQRPPARASSPPAPASGQPVRARRKPARAGSAPGPANRKPARAASPAARASSPPAMASGQPARASSPAERASSQPARASGQPEIAQPATRREAQPQPASLSTAAMHDERG